MRFYRCSSRTPVTVAHGERARTARNRDVAQRRDAMTRAEIDGFGPGPLDRRRSGPSIDVDQQRPAARLLMTSLLPPSTVVPPMPALTVAPPTAASTDRLPLLPITVSPLSLTISVLTPERRRRLPVPVPP